MDKTTFWQLIERTREEADGDCDMHMSLLQEALVALPPQEIVEFDRIYGEYFAQSYQWPLWGAAFLIGGGCSDDGFDYFRNWLISRGKAQFEAALADPDSLADQVREEDYCELEELPYVIVQAWSEKTGQPEREFPERPVETEDEPLGEPWQEEELERRFPRLAGKLGWV
ncbi:DUF4240 domain-containing protein [Chitinimonas lacunae]|uniref:DUF4240 domain-containing protein n=1 Tax=Chitinimonas lacunae TaxID=1963018 RepID=A0ABV8MK06_9NEIS